MDIKDYKIEVSKHFGLGWMKKWNYDKESLRNAIENAYKTEKIGKEKHEVYIHAKGKSRKLIFVKNEEYKEIFIITGAEGR